MPPKFIRVVLTDKTVYFLNVKHIRAAALPAEFPDAVQLSLSNDQMVEVNDADGRLKKVLAELATETVAVPCKTGPGNTTPPKFVTVSTILKRYVFNAAQIARIEYPGGTPAAEVWMVDGSCVKVTINPNLFERFARELVA